MDSEIITAIVAFIQPFQLDRVVNALRRLPDFSGMSVSDVRGFGRHGAHPPHRGERGEVGAFAPAVRIEIFCRAPELGGFAMLSTFPSRTKTYLAPPLTHAFVQDASDIFLPCSPAMWAAPRGQ